MKSVGFFAFSQILGIVWENHFVLVTICFSMYYKKSIFQNVKIPEVTLGKIFSLAAKFMHFVVFFDGFPKGGPIFPKNVGFSGNLWENDCFPQIAAVSLHQLSARSELELMSLKRKARSCSFLLWKQKLCEWCSRAIPSLYRVRKVRTDR